MTRYAILINTENEDKKVLERLWNYLDRNKIDYYEEYENKPEWREMPSQFDIVKWVVIIAIIGVVILGVLRSLTEWGGV